MPHIETGLRLRSLGLSYAAIAIVLAEYHDFCATEEGVRRQLRKHGAPPVPWGRDLGALRRNGKVPA